MGKKKRTNRPGVSWARSANGFIPHYRFRGMHALGPERPFPQYLKGERMLMARYFMCLVCEALFNHTPLTFEVGNNGQDFSKPRLNEDFNELPFMEEDPESPTGWRMNDGNPDVLGMFDFGKQFAKAAAEAQTEDAEQHGAG